MSTPPLPLDERTYYVPSGNCDAGLMLRLANVGLLAIGMGCMQAILHFLGALFPLLVVILMTLPLPHYLGRAIHRGKCRSSAVYWLAACLIAATLMGARFVATGVGAGGWQVLANPRAVATAAIDNINRTRWKQRPMDEAREAPLLSWSIIAVEGVFVFGLTLVLGSGPLGLPFSERADQWLESTRIGYARGSGKLIRESLAAGELAAALTELPRNPAGPPQYDEVIFYRLPIDHPLIHEEPIYLAIRERLGGADGAPWLVRPTELTPEELVELRSIDLIPVLLPQPPRSARPLAVARPLSRTKRNDIVPGLAALERKEIFMVLAPLTVSAVGWVIAGNSLYVESMPQGAIGMAIMFSGGGVILLAQRWLPPFPALRERLFCDASQGRIDPEMGRMLVHITPRSGWKNWWMHGVDVADLGLLQLDVDRRLLRFEGEHELWAIPVERIKTSAVECPTPTATEGEDGASFVAILQITLDDAIWEIGFQIVEEWAPAPNFSDRRGSAGLFAQIAALQMEAVTSPSSAAARI